MICKFLNWFSFLVKLELENGMQISACQFEVRLDAALLAAVAI
jgi:hypothetical protein